MRRLFVLYILMVTLPVFASGIGDFAPLKIGNVWVYDCLSTHSGIEETLYDSGTYTIKLLATYTKNDTVCHCFGTNSKRIVVSDNRKDEKSADTLFVDSISFDTLYEVNDTLRSNLPYPLEPAMFTSHRIDTFPTFTQNPLVLKDGKYECRYSFLDGSSNTLYQYVYRQDVGLTSFEWSQMIHMDQRNRTITLRSFTGSQIAISRNQQRKAHTLERPISAVKRLSVPYLSVVRGEHAYNLLGRTDRSMASRSIPQRYRKIER